MKRFLCRITFGAISVVLLAVGIVALRIEKNRAAFDKVFTLTPEQKILFSGDSHVGCMIEEAPCYGNKVLWNSSSGLQFSIVRLLELERKGALKNVDFVVVKFGYNNVYSHHTLNLSAGNFATLAPIAWRYPTYFTWHEQLEGYLRILKGGQLLYSDMMTPTESAPQRNTSLSDTPEEDIAKQGEDIKKWFQGNERFKARARERYFNAIHTLHQITQRNEAQLLFYFPPLSSYARELVPDEAKQDFETVKRFLAQRNIPLIDTSASVPDTDFLDLSHLNLQGRKTFTEYFFSLIKPLRAE